MFMQTVQASSGDCTVQPPMGRAGEVLSAAHIWGQGSICALENIKLLNDGDPHYPGSRGHVPWGYMLMTSPDLFCPCILKDTLSSYL